MGMKVAAVALLVRNTRVFQAMEMAGTPCPYMGDDKVQDATKFLEKRCRKKKRELTTKP
jgi:hypothetical protein